MSAVRDFAARAVPYLQIGYALMLTLSEGPAQLMCVLTLVALVLSGGLRGYRPSIIEFGIIVWGLSGLVGHLSFDAHVSSGDMTRPLLALALLVGASVARADDRTIERVAIAFAIGFTINAAYGLMQRSFGALPLDSLLLSNPRSGQIWAPGWPRVTRAASGLFYNRLRLAHVGVTVLVMLVPLVLDKTLRTKRRVLVTLAFGIGMLAVLFAYARMALIAFGAALAVGFVLNRVKWRVVVGTLVAGGATIAVVFSTEGGRRAVELLMRDAWIRRAMFSSGIAVAKSHPWFGVGHGVYRHVSAAYMPEGLARVTHTSPHNQWLQVLAETGVVGLLGFSVALFGGVYLAVRVARRVNDANDAVAQLARWSLGALVCICVIGLTHFALHHASVGLVAWTAVGVAIGVDRRLRPAANTP